MNVSFSLARKLGIGVLLGIVLLESAVSVMSIRDVAKEMYRKVEAQHTKERLFTQMALRFATAGSDFYRYRHLGTLPGELPKLRQQLNTIRSILAQLQALPLTPIEHEGITKLHFEEKRFRTALYVYVNSGVDDPSQETAARAAEAIEELIANAVARAIHYSYVTSETVEQTNGQMVQSAHHTTMVLTIGAGVAAIAGLCVSLMLSRALQRHLNVILHAMHECGKGNFLYRIKAPFKDAMGQLAGSVDDMTSRLEAYEHQHKTMLTELMDAKDISDQQAQELAARALELDRARQAAETASRTKSQFLANTSHELRTPMNGVLGMTELLLSTDLTARQRHLVEMARQSGDLLLNIINDILDLSKIEAGKLELEHTDFNLPAIVEDTVKLFADRAHRKGLELLCTVHPTVCTTVQGDPLRLCQILTNLLSNAIKFTLQGEVAVRVIPAAASLVRFEIRDTGIGIGPDLQERIFDAFAQADGSTTRQYGGTSLGLAIAKQLVEMMGGTMDVVSTNGQGATFRFTAHLEPSPASSPASCTPHAGLQGLRALIVDDNATSREMLHERLTAWGFHSRSTASGEHVLTLLQAAATQSTPYDLALLDWQMPGMDGLALAGAIKADPVLATMPLVLLIPHGDDSAIQAAQQAGVAYTLTTPISTSQLYDCLAAVLGLARICPAESDLRQHAAPTAQPSLSGHVLLAEDNPVNQEVAVSMLESLGCRVTVAATGREAVAAVQQRAYSVVLMDCHMPELDGLTATRALFGNGRPRLAPGLCPLLP